MTQHQHPGVVVLDYGSGNLRSAERALERAGAEGRGHRRLPRRHRVRRPRRPRRRRLRRLRGRAAGGRRRAHPRAAPRRRPPGARHLRRHAGALRARRRVRRGGRRGRAVARHRREAARRRPAAHGLEHGARPRPTRTLFAGMAADERFYFVHSFAARRWEMEPVGAVHPAEGHVGPPRRGLRRRGRERRRSRPPSSTRRSPATPGAACWQLARISLELSRRACRSPRPLVRRTGERRGRTGRRGDEGETACAT